MTNAAIRTLVVDDDFRVADVHAGYVQAVPGFAVVGIAHTAAQALQMVVDLAPDLTLLDLYLPDQHGLDLMHRIAEAPNPPDVLVISAARDLAGIRRAMQQGAIGYLAKPFGAALLGERLNAYRDLRRRMIAMTSSGPHEAEQAEIDGLFALLGGSTMIPAPKGQSDSTMHLVRQAVQRTSSDVSAVQVAEAVGISRPTAQRYLAYLAQHRVIELRLRYGTTGRPEHRYRWPGN
ncbi:MAG: response regulator [Nakamurella sp.]